MCVQYGSKTFGFYDSYSNKWAVSLKRNTIDVNSKIFGKAYWKGFLISPVTDKPEILNGFSSLRVYPNLAMKFVRLIICHQTIRLNATDKLEIIRMNYTTNTA